MADTIVSSFQDSLEAEMARAALVRAGIAPSAISIVSTTSDSDGKSMSGTYDESNPFLPGLKRKVLRDNLVDAADNSKEGPWKVIAGFLFGCFVGAGLAWLATIEPALSALVDAEPIMFFIGMSVAGGMLGAIIMALSSSARENNVLHYYKEAGKERWVVGVDCEHKLASAVVKIMVRNGGSDVKFITKTVPATSFQFRPGQGSSENSRVGTGTTAGRR